MTLSGEQERLAALLLKFSFDQELKERCMALTTDEARSQACADWLIAHGVSLPPLGGELEELLIAWLDGLQPLMEDGKPFEGPYTSATDKLIRAAQKLKAERVTTGEQAGDARQNPVASGAAEVVITSPAVPRGAPSEPLPPWTCVDCARPTWSTDHGDGGAHRCIACFDKRRRPAPTLAERGATEGAVDVAIEALCLAAKSIDRYRIGDVKPLIGDLDRIAFLAAKALLLLLNKDDWRLDALDAATREKAAAEIRFAPERHHAAGFTLPPREAQLEVFLRELLQTVNGSGEETSLRLRIRTYLGQWDEKEPTGSTDCSVSVKEGSASPASAAPPPLERLREAAQRVLKVLDDDSWRTAATGSGWFEEKVAAVDALRTALQEEGKP